MTIPTLLIANRTRKQKEKLQQAEVTNAEKEQIEISPNVVDFRANEQLAKKWKGTKH
ncbi:hypothetical protein Q4591_18780 [Shewanella sp. 3_MG-2023]|uniref:hypothetical protein n=1 Tax=Shewanella sp. 3_MG-2023 TaxID=3062635 RepID=UPI0026E38D6F|nr:hypothetical protein [Shewanella sp. 3_MG-2023]MDO6777389.1 hypothetical protein [Shewanella sp. 3_MG-2023]